MTEARTSLRRSLPLVIIAGAVLIAIVVILFKARTSPRPSPNRQERIAALQTLLSEQREWGQRKKQLETAALLTDLDPDNPRRWADLLELQSAQSEDEDAIETIRQALHHEFPAEFRCYLLNTLVQQLVNRGDAAAARRELEQLRELEGDSARVQGIEVYVCRLEGDLPKALQIVNGIVGKSPGLPFPRFTRGIILLDLRELEQAADDLKQVIAAQPFNAPAHFKLSEAYRGLGQPELAARHQQAATDIVKRQRRISALLNERETNPLDAKVYRELEQLYRELGDIESARLWQRWATRVAKSS